NDDAASGDKFAAESLYTQSFADTIAPIADAALTFLVCHNFQFDLFNLHHRQVLSVSHGTVIALTTLHLKSNFLGATRVGHYVSHNRRLGEGRRTHRYLPILA